MAYQVGLSRLSGKWIFVGELPVVKDFAALLQNSEIFVQDMSTLFNCITVIL